MTKMVIKKWLAKLLVDKHVIGLLLKLLKCMQIENRKNTAEKEQEWQWSRDWDGENKLG